MLRNRCSFRCRAKVAVDSDVRRRSIGRLFQMSGTETAKFLRPMVVAVRCTPSLPEAADLRCLRPTSSTTGWQSSARYGGARPRSHLLTSIAILYFIRWSTGSQCKSRRIGVMWSNLRVPVISRVRHFELLAAFECHSQQLQVPQTFWPFGAYVYSFIHGMYFNAFYVERKKRIICVFYFFGKMARILTYLF